MLKKYIRVTVVTRNLEFSCPAFNLHCGRLESFLLHAYLAWDISFPLVNLKKKVHDVDIENAEIMRASLTDYILVADTRSQTETAVPPEVFHCSLLPSSALLLTQLI